MRYLLVAIMLIMFMGSVFFGFKYGMDWIPSNRGAEYTWIFLIGLGVYAYFWHNRN